MVQPVLAARNLSEGQRGANFTGWLKILDVAIYIFPEWYASPWSRQGSSVMCR